MSKEFLIPLYWICNLQDPTQKQGCSSSALAFSVKILAGDHGHLFLQLLIMYVAPKAPKQGARRGNPPLELRLKEEGLNIKRSLEENLNCTPTWELSIKLNAKRRAGH